MMDGFAILKSVAGQAELFVDARDAADKAALSILSMQLKAKTCDLQRLKRICKALGADTLALALEHFPDTLPKALIRRLDPHHPHAATGSAAWMREHVVALASDAAKPEAKPATRSKTGAAKSKADVGQAGDVVTEAFWATSVMAKPSGAAKAPRKPKRV